MRTWSTTLRARDAAELPYGLRIAAFAAVAPLIARLPLRYVEAIVEPRRGREAAPAERVARAVSMTDAILRRARPIVRPGCLTRGLTLLYFLRRAGVDVRLAFGIAQLEDGPAGHCWLVRDGHPYLERTDPRPIFTEMYSIPRAHAPS